MFSKTCLQGFKQIISKPSMYFNSTTIKHKSEHNCLICFFHFFPFFLLPLPTVVASTVAPHCHLAHLSGDFSRFTVSSEPPHRSEPSIPHASNGSRFLLYVRCRTEQQTCFFHYPNYWIEHDTFLDFRSILMCGVGSLLSSLQECDQSGIDVLFSYSKSLSSTSSCPLILFLLLHIISISHSDLLTLLL